MKTESYIYTGFCITCLLATAWTGALSTCRVNRDCDDDYCCAFRIKHNAGYCMPTRGLGDICSINFEKGRTFSCGCRTGLTCAIVDKDKRTGEEKTRCVLIPPEAREQQEKSNSTVFANQFYTAIELRKIFSRLQGNPQTKKVKE